MNAEKIPVRIRLDRWQCSLSPFVIRIDPEMDHVVEWTCPEGSVEIEFEGENPFTTGEALASRDAGRAIRSGVLRRGLERRARFPYFVIVRSDIGVLARIPGLILVTPGTSSIPVEVKILQNTDGSLRVEPDRVTLKRKMDERAEWTCEFGRFEINFDKPDGTPFEDWIFAAESGRGARSGNWKGGLLPWLNFAYSVRVWLPDGTIKELDPGVVVDDGGGDDGL